MCPQLVRYHLYALHFLQILWNEKAKRKRKKIENRTFRQHQNSLKHWFAKSNQINILECLDLPRLLLVNRTGGAGGLSSSLDIFAYLFIYFTRS